MEKNLRQICTKNLFEKEMRSHRYKNRQISHDQCLFPLYNLITVTELGRESVKTLKLTVQLQPTVKHT